MSIQRMNVPHRRLPNRWRGALIAVSLVLIAGCANPPIEVPGQTLAQRPDDIATADDPPTGRVLWGGIIVGGENLNSATQLEVLAYPLDRIQRPQIDVETQGRFLIIADGYLETLDFAAGREVTVLGKLTGTVSGEIGTAKYRYPQVVADQLHLWRASRYAPPRFSFGLGVSLSN